MAKSIYISFLIKAFLASVSLWLFCTVPSFSQLHFSGLGRTVWQSQTLSGDALQGDSTSDRKTMQGYALFDLRTEYHFKDKFNLLVDSRVKNIIGGFGGVGASVQLRQVLLEGKATRFVTYSLGDVDVELSPFTFSNQVDSSALGSGSIFTLRRIVVQYENFNQMFVHKNGFNEKKSNPAKYQILGRFNSWRMRGAKIQFRIPFSEQHLQSLNGLVFGVTDRASHSFSSDLPYRIGGRVSFYTGFKHRFLLYGNGVRNLTPLISNGKNENQVLSAGADIRLSYSNIEITGSMEAGSSQSQWKTDQALINIKRDDYFMHSNLALSWKQRISIGGSYSEVGPYFESPGAQTMRLTGSAVPSFFSSVSNNQITRNQGMLDRIGSETIYNQSLSVFRQVYLPQYELVFPYSVATPNRKGFSVNSTFQDHADGFEKFKVNVKANFYQEILGTGVTDLRDFTRLQATGTSDLRRIFHLRRTWNLNVGYRFESSKRGGDLPVDFKVNSWEAGTIMEIVRDLDLMIGIKRLNAKGNEIYNNINRFNEIESYRPFTIDQSETLIGTGMQLHFSQQCFLLVSGYFNRVKSIERLSTWNLNQIYTNFTYEF
jgi:hypothetical protein